MQDHRLQLGHPLDGGARPLLADATAFQPAVWHEIGPPQRRPVHVNVPGIDVAGKTNRVRQISGEDAGRETEPRVIRQLDGMVDVAGRADCDRWTEELVLAERALGVHVGDDGWRQHGAVALAAGNNLGAIR